jgi:hypothetical protein
MIANAKELEVAYRNLNIFEQTLEGVRRELLTSNPRLVPVAANGYERQIQALKSEISAYLRSHPTDVTAELAKS